MTSSPNVTPTKNRSLLQKVAHSNMWSANRRGVDAKGPREDMLHESIISADQVQEASYYKLLSRIF